MADIRSINSLDELKPRYAVGARRLFAAILDIAPFLVVANALLRGHIGDAAPQLAVSEPLWWYIPIVFFAVPLWLFSLAISGSNALVVDPLGEVSLQFVFAMLMATPILLIFESTTGRTPGKLLFGIKVVDTAGRRPGIKRSGIRNLTRFYDFTLTWFLFVPLILWDILVRRPLPGWASGAYRFVWSDQRQRWGDELAGTYVIKGRWNPVRLGSHAPASSRKNEGRTVRSRSGSIRLSGKTPGG